MEVMFPYPAQERTPHRQKTEFARLMRWHVEEEKHTKDLCAELREISAQQGRPMGYPLCFGLVLTQSGVRHALQTPDGSYRENRPLYAWKLNVGASAVEAAAAVRQALASYGEGANRFVYPIGVSLEQLEEQDFAQLARCVCFPCFSVVWMVRAAARLGARPRERQPACNAEGVPTPLPALPESPAPSFSSLR